MPKPKIHLRHPKLGYHACGAGNSNSVQMTDNPKEVTCKRCQETTTGRKAAPNGYPNLTRAGAGAPRKGARSRINTQVSPKTRDYLVKLGGGERRVGRAIEKLVAFHQKHQEV